MKIGYARCSTEKQDLRAQKQQLRALGVDSERIYTDHGYTGRTKDRPGLAQALAAAGREGDILVVTKLDRLGRSISDVSAIAAQLTSSGAKLQMGSTVYDPQDPFGRMFFNLTATFAEFEADLISQRTKEGLQIAREHGKLTGRRTRFSAYQQQRMRDMLSSGEWSHSEIAQLMGTSRSWISRLASRWRAQGLLDQTPVPPDTEETTDAR